MDLNATCGSGSILYAAVNQTANCSGDRTPTLFRPLSAHSVLYLLTLAFIVLASFVGNLLVLVTVFWTPSLHRTNNALMVSLAVADLLRTAVVMPIHGYLRLAAENIATEGKYLAGNRVCPIHCALLVGLDVAVILSVTLIGIERVFIIVRPLKYICTVTRSKLGLTIGGIWAACLASGMLHIMRPHNNILELPVTSLTSNALTLTVLNLKTCRNPMKSTADVIASSFFLFIVPLVVIVGCYGKIFLIVGHQIRRLNPQTVNPRSGEQSENRWQPDNSVCENGGGQPKEACSPRVWVTVTSGQVVGSRAGDIETERLGEARTVGSELISSSMVSLRDAKVKQFKGTMSSSKLQQRRSRVVHRPLMQFFLKNYWRKCGKNRVAPSMQTPPYFRRPQCMPLGCETVDSRSKPSMSSLKAVKHENKGKSLGIVIEKSLGTGDVVGMRTRDTLRPGDVLQVVEQRAGRFHRGRSLPMLLTGQGGGRVTPGLTATSTEVGDASSNRSGTGKLSEKSQPSGPLMTCHRVVYKRNPYCTDPAVRVNDCGVGYGNSGISANCIGRTTINRGSDIDTIVSNEINIWDRPTRRTTCKASDDCGDVGREKGCGGGCGAGVYVICDNEYGVTGCDRLTPKINNENQANLSTNGVKDDSFDPDHSDTRQFSPIQSTSHRSIPLCRPDLPFPTPCVLSPKPGFHFTWAASPRKERDFSRFHRSGKASLGICKRGFVPPPRSARRLMEDPFGQDSDHPPPPPAIRRTESVSSRTTMSSFVGFSRPSLLVRLTGNRALKMMSVVISSFLVSWLPLQLCSVLSFFCSSEDLVPSAAWDVADLCAFLASALHPLIYDFYSSEFRRALRSVLWPRRRPSGVV